MSVILNPYISLRGQAREALDFYQSVFGGEVTGITFGQFSAEGVPAEWLMHGQLNAPDGLTLMCSDVPEFMELTPGSSISISLSGDDERQREWFAKLGEGGEVTLPMERQMWGDEHGQLVDRFGVRWMATLSAPQA